MTVRSLTFALIFIAATSAFAQENENRAAATLQRMNTVATAIAAYITDANASPEATSVEALRPLLVPTYIRELPVRDGWDTPLRYRKTGKESFQIISAGSDKTFDEKSWATPIRTRDLAADAVYANGKFERVWVDATNAPLALTTEEGVARAKPFVDRFNEKTKGMTEEEARTYLHTSGTRRSMFVLGAWLEMFKKKKGAYPPGQSMADLQRALFPEFTSDVEKTDWWGTEFRYIAPADGKSYMLVSAGSDRTFDESSWQKSGTLASADDDAVLRNGEFTRMWDEHTRPGATPESRRRDALKPAARAALQRADTLHAANDAVGALGAYMDAVNADPAAADFESIRRYRGFESPSNEKAAVEQYLRIHPGDWDATNLLAAYVDLPQAEALFAPFFKTRPDDPQLFAARGIVRSKHHAYEKAYEDYAKAAELDPQNPERQYIVGVVEYEAVAKGTELSEKQKREHIRRGIDAMKRAEAMKPDYFEAMSYHNLLLRQQALLEKDPQSQKKLNAEADALRERAVEIIKKRKP